MIAFLIVCAYMPALNGPMVLDDHGNIIENPQVAIHDLSFASLKSALLSNDSGPLKRPLPALSFAINHFIAGNFTNTFVFKATNLVIHVINTALVFWLAYLLWPRLLISNKPISRQNRTVISLFTALAWSLHPIHTTAVAYVVQRMTSMSGTFVFLGLCLFIIGRERFEQKGAHGLLWMWAGVLGGAFLSLLCKENGALLPLYAGVIEFTLFGGLNKAAGKVSNNGLQHRESSSVIQLHDKVTVLSHIKNFFIPRFITLRLQRFACDKQYRQLIYFYSLTLILPALAAFTFFFIYPGHLLDSYGGRPFTLSQRLLTEARVLWFYLYLLFAPNINLMGLFHDDIPISTGWLTPWSTLLALLGWGLAVILAVSVRKRIPLLSFAIFWYLAGHSLESTFIPLYVAFEYRNYVPAFGMALLVINGIFYLYGRFIAGTRLQPALLCAGICAGLFYAALSSSESWRTEEILITSLAKNHPLSAFSQYLYGELLLKKFNKPSRAFAYFHKAAQLEPNEVGILIKIATATPLEDLSNPNNQQQTALLESQRIISVLKNKPVSAWGFKSLDIEARCVIARHQSCLDRHETVINWLDALLQNPRLPLNYIRHFTGRLFEIEMKYKLYDDALKTIKKAKSKDLSFPAYYLMHAEALALLGHYSLSLSVLNQVDYQFSGFDSNVKTRVDRMRFVIKKLAMYH